MWGDSRSKALTPDSFPLGGIREQPNLALSRRSNFSSRSRELDSVTANGPIFFLALSPPVLFYFSSRFVLLFTTNAMWWVESNSCAKMTKIRPKVLLVWRYVGSLALKRDGASIPIVPRTASRKFRRFYIWETTPVWNGWSLSVALRFFSVEYHKTPNDLIERNICEKHKKCSFQFV